MAFSGQIIVAEVAYFWIAPTDLDLMASKKNGLFFDQMRAVSIYIIFKMNPAQYFQTAPIRGFFDKKLPGKPGHSSQPTRHLRLPELDL